MTDREFWLVCLSVLAGCGICLTLYYTAPQQNPPPASAPTSMEMNL